MSTVEMALLLDRRRVRRIVDAVPKPPKGSVADAVRETFPKGKAAVVLPDVAR